MRNEHPTQSETNMNDQTQAVLDLRAAVGEDHIFGAAFVKKNGDLRTGSFRLGVTKDQTGVGLSYDSNAAGNLIVFDMQKKAYRTIKLNSLRKLTVGGRVIFSIEEEV